MRARASALLLVFAAATLGTAIAQVTQSPNGHLFRMKWTKGDVFSYAGTSNTQVGQQKFPMTLDFSIKVDSVANGVANVTVTSTTPMTQKPTTTKMKMDGRGEVGNSSGLTNVPKLPAGPIKVGGSWTDETKVTQGGVSMTIKTTYTFRGIKTVDKVQCAELDVKATSTGQMSSTTTGKTYIQVSNGQLFKSDSTSVASMTVNGQTQKFNSTVSIKRK